MRESAEVLHPKQSGGPRLPAGPSQNPAESADAAKILRISDALRQLFRRWHRVFDYGELRSELGLLLDLNVEQAEAALSKAQDRGLIAVDDENLLVFPLEALR